MIPADVRGFTLLVSGPVEGGKNADDVRNGATVTAGGARVCVRGRLLVDPGTGLWEEGKTTGLAALLARSPTADRAEVV